MAGISRVLKSTGSRFLPRVFRIQVFRACLGEVADARGGAGSAFSRVNGDDARQDFQQGGLARAVIYARGVWQPVLEYFLPVQMCHMRVNEKYRVWHDCCLLYTSSLK